MYNCSVEREMCSILARSLHSSSDTVVHSINSSRLGCPDLKICSGRIILLGRAAVCRNYISAHVQVPVQLILFDRSAVPRVHVQSA